MKVNDKVFLVDTDLEIKEVTIRSIDNIGYHGSGFEVMYFKENVCENYYYDYSRISKNYSEAREKLLKMLSIKIEQERKELKKLKKNIKNLELQLEDLILN